MDINVDSVGHKLFLRYKVSHLTNGNEDFDEYILFDFYVFTKDILGTA